MNPYQFRTLCTWPSGDVRPVLATFNPANLTVTIEWLEPNYPGLGASRAIMHNVPAAWIT